MTILSTLLKIDTDITLQVKYDDTIVEDSDLEWLESVLNEFDYDEALEEESIEVQVGWMPVLLVKENDHEYSFQELDFLDSVSADYTHSATQTIQHIRLQIALCESLETELDHYEFSDLNHAMLVSDDVEKIENVYLFRTDQQGEFSGWVMNDLDTLEQFEPKNGKLISLYELANRRADLVPYFALPVGYAVHIQSGDVVRIIENEQEMAIQPDSLLAHINAQRQATDSV